MVGHESDIPSNLQTHLILRLQEIYSSEDGRHSSGFYGWARYFQAVWEADIGT